MSNEEGITARQSQPITVYQFNEKGLVKLQVGDYLYYPQADSIKRRFRQTHFPGAWIVKTNVFIPISAPDTNLISAMQASAKDSAKNIYKIQIMATGDKNKAQNIVEDLNMQFSGKAFYEQSGNIFKIFVGYFEKENDARAALESIREERYPDAWLVY